MKPRHAVALALIGWYLMTPPPKFDPATHLAVPGAVDIYAPFKFWDQRKIFDSAQECEAAQRSFAEEDRQFMARLHKEEPGWFKHEHDQGYEKTQDAKIDRELGLPKGSTWSLKDFWSVRNDYARCVATDDPRLKAK